jgi:hypothetical protein
MQGLQAEVGPPDGFEIAPNGNRNGYQQQLNHRLGQNRQARESDETHRTADSIFATVTIRVGLNKYEQKNKDRNRGYKRPKRDLPYQGTPAPSGLVTGGEEGARFVMALPVRVTASAAVA